MYRSFNRVHRWFCYFFTIVLFSLPLVFLWLSNHDFLGESLAYRYFASMRILNGDAEGIWLPQGYLINIVQHVIVFFTKNHLNFNSEALRQNFNIFGYATNVVIVFFAALISAYAFFSKKLDSIDRTAFVFTLLIPVYGFLGQGIYYSILPDYYHLNIVLVSLTVLIFFVEFKNQKHIEYKRAFLLGLFVGLCTSNKITMLLISSAVFIPSLTQENQWNFKRASLVFGIAILGVITSFTVVFLIFYLFDWHLLVQALYNIQSFSTQSWIQPNFTNLVESLLLAKGYLYAIVLFIFIASLAISQNYKTTHCSLKLLQIGVLITIGLFQLWFVWRRPAETTFFESIVSINALTLMLITIFFKTSLARLFLIGMGLTNLLFSINGVIQQYQGILERSENARLGWQEFRKIEKMKHKVIVIVPDNEYFFREADPFETLLKGVVDFPTWNIAAGKIYLEKLESPVSFRSEQMKFRPNDPYPENDVLVWFDRNDYNKPLVSAYPQLAKAVNKLNCSYIDLNKSLRRWVCMPKAMTIEN
jgi:hypothetical protein